MKRAKEFPFERARRSTRDEIEAAHKAINSKLGVDRPMRGRPPKKKGKFKPVYIRLHPRALQWARAEAKKRGIGYQTLINQTLLDLAA